MKKLAFTTILLWAFGAMGIAKNNLKPKRPTVVTVYVHGTLFQFRKIFSKIPAAAKLTYVPDGLSLVKNLDTETLTYDLATDFCVGDPKRFSLDDFYAFGWSGKLSFKERQKWGKILAQQLSDLSKEYVKRDGIAPVIKVVTFSHGGNVALNMAQFLRSKIKIELFLVACPIQPDTEKFALSECFSKIYTIYSLNDLIQVVDPANICRNIKRKIKKESTSKKILSMRYFVHDSSKIKQACVTVNGKHIGHLELFHLFNKHIPFVLQRLDSLPEIKGTNMLNIDICDQNFCFLNGVNIVKVLQGKEKGSK